MRPTSRWALAQFFLLFRLVVIEFFSNYPKHTCLFAWIAWDDDDDVVPGMIGGVCQLILKNCMVLHVFYTVLARNNDSYTFNKLAATTHI